MLNKQACSKGQFPNTVGPNFLWHVDGYDKLKQFGFAIHGAIVGYVEY